MAVKDLIEQAKGKEESDKPETEEVETSDLFNSTRVKAQKEKLHNEHLCPNCGESDTEKAHYYWRCKNSDCDTITYIPVRFMQLKGE